MKSKIINRSSENLLPSISVAKVRAESNVSEFAPSMTHIFRSSPPARVNRHSKTVKFKRSELDDKMMKCIKAGMFPGKPYLETQTLKNLKKLV